MDLTTAEVYVAAVLSNDSELQEVFKSGGNFHSTIAHKVFNLPCDVSEVAEKFSDKRQAAKAVTFGIMYGAGPKKISEQVTKDGGNMSMKEAQIVIRDYFAAFPGLKDWIEDQKSHIARFGELYSLYGRKRRLRDGIETQQIRDLRKKKNWMISDDEKAMLGAQAGAVRSGLNFLVQSSASDINLLGAVDAEQQVRERGMKSRIFALVHDSVLAEVPLDEIDEYSQILRDCIQKDRGIMIEGCPVGCDFEVGDDYSMGKFDDKYSNL
jgi:DNA polymerase I-like protein with 3'-5' exonuclease and polymerase domains